MRIALLVHAFPPHSNTGVEVYSEALARALGALGHELEVFAPRRERDALHLAQRRERRANYALTSLTLSESLDDEERRRVSPGAAQAFGRFLDRERPDVLHIQHFLGLGAGVIDEARAREIPVVFSAHDAHAFCDDYTLIAPDLSPLEPPDARAQARCRLARGVLDKGLAAHDGYLVPEWAEADLLKELRATLTSSGPEVEALAVQIEADLKARREALERADRIESPTQFLADKLRAAGLRSEVHVRACGIQGDTLRAAREPHEGPLRVLYLGGYFEHKGVHVLLQAAARCPAAIQLTLRGCAGSSDYLEHLQGLAGDARAELGGPFEREELARLLADADLLALPSLWPENAPFVLREAFAAGLPVLVSDTPALRESVRDGQDGRLIPMGDVQAWSEALQALAQDRPALENLAQAVQAPKSIEEDAAQLAQIYAELCEARKQSAGRRRERLPEHLQAFAERQAALERLSMRELTRRSIDGLLKMTEREGIALPELAGAQAMLEGSERLRERLAAAGRSDTWRAQVACDRERALCAAQEHGLDLELGARSERERAEWQSRLRQEREERLEWLQSQVQAAGEGLAALGQELQLARETCTELERRVGAGQGLQQSTEQELEWRLQQLRSREDQLQWTQQQLDDARQGAAEWQLQLSAREEQLREMGTQLERLSSELDKLGRAHECLANDRAAVHGHQGFLESELVAQAERNGQMTTQLAQLGDELAWRTNEMVAAQAEAHSFISRTLGGRLSRRTRSWSENEGESC